MSYDFQKTEDSPKYQKKDDLVEFRFNVYRNRAFRYPKRYLYKNMESPEDFILGEKIHAVAINYFDSIQAVLDDLAVRGTMIHPYKIVPYFECGDDKPSGHIMVGIREKENLS